MVDKHGWNGNTALHLAAMEGYTKAVELLVKNKANIEAANSFGAS